MKTTISLLLLFILILGGGYLLYVHNQPSAPAYAPTASTANTATSSATSATAAPSIAPAGAAAPSNAPNSYTSAQVAAHATSQSCWTSINGSVYDLTKWISQHPGGMAPILGICGKDGSQAFNQQHGRAGDTRPKDMLATFKIGVLAS